MAKERKPLMAKSSLVEKEEALKKMIALSQNQADAPSPILPQQEDNASSNKDIHRYNIEIPNDLFQEIKAFITENGYNLKGFFLTAARDKMKKEKF